VGHCIEKIDSNIESEDYHDLRFYTSFPQIDQRISKPYKCFIINPMNNILWEGESYVCSEAFCVAINSPTFGEGALLSISIPFTDIIGITKAGKKYHHDHINKKKDCKQNGGSHNRLKVISLKGAGIKPTVIQIWTRNKEVHQFCGFGLRFDGVYSQICDNWNAIQLK